MTPDVLEVAVEPRTSADWERLDRALTHLIDENQSFHFTTDRESGQTILEGMGEVLLEDLVDRIRREFEVEANVGSPQVAYRETLAQAVEVDHTHKRPLGPMYQFGRVKAQVAPGERGSGQKFFDEVSSGSIPREFIPSVEKGMLEAAERGSLVGFPIIDFEIHLIGGAYHDIDSSALAFEIAGRGAMREAAQKAGIKLLEPIMKVEITTQKDYLGDVVNVLSSRGAELQGTDSRRSSQNVTAIAPMAKLFGLEKELRSLTEGNAVASISWDRYDFVEASGTDPDDTFPAAVALRA